MSTSGMKVALVNPNTNEETTASMVKIAKDAAATLGLSSVLDFQGVTAPFGEPLITNPAALEVAAEAVLSLEEQLFGFAAVIIAAFGDPGRALLSQKLALHGIPVVGIGQASMNDANDRSSGRFVVAQTIPELNRNIAAMAHTYGYSKALLSVRSPQGDGAALMRNDAAVEEALAALISAAMEEDGARAVIIGGGPLAKAARALAGRFEGCAIIEPIPSAVARVARELGVNAAPARSWRL